MVQFADSPHQAAQRRYESACRQANASNQNARKSLRQQIEDRLVTGGQQAIDDYESLLNERWKKAGCLAEYDGISMGYLILERAKARLVEQPTGDDAA